MEAIPVQSSDLKSNSYEAKSSPRLSLVNSSPPEVSSVSLTAEASRDVVSSTVNDSFPWRCISSRRVLYMKAIG